MKEIYEQLGISEEVYNFGCTGGNISEKAL